VRIASSKHTNDKSLDIICDLDILYVMKFLLFIDYKCKNILASADPGKLLLLKYDYLLRRV